MPSLAPYIPPRDGDLSTWGTNFAALIAAAPGTYGLTSGDATVITSVTAAYTAAYNLAVSPSTRTPSNVQAKNVAKISMLATVRPYAQTIALNAGVSSDDKIALGINPRTSTPQPITTPTTNPVLTIAQALTLQHVVRYRDSLASPSVKSKPYGVIGVQVFGTASATPITDQSMLDFLQQTTKSPFTTTWASGDLGKEAYYAARWVTRTGLVGPWSPIIKFTVAG